MAEESSTKCKFKNVNVNVPIKSALTQKCCAHVVIEIIKHLAYQRYQIPYIYHHLSLIIGKKREKEKHNTDVSESLASKKYFGIASAAIDGLEAIFENIRIEFETRSLEEVCIVFGSNIICAKEFYQIKIPKELDAHYECNHHQESQKIIPSILRTIICCNELTNLVSQTLSPTNMHIFIKRRDNSFCDDSNFFLPVNTLKIPQRAHKAVIDLDYSANLVHCCKHLKIYDDFSANFQNGLKISENSLENGVDFNNDLLVSINNNNWYRGRVCMKGFKAMLVNGKYVANSWES